MAAPTCTILAPAIIISTASSQEEIPPMPHTGIFTAFATCHTMRTATGNTAGPESPPVLLRSTGRRVLISILIPKRVLISDTASAPSDSQARAISAMSVTLGDSFIITGLFVAERTIFVISAAPEQDTPNAAPPAFTLGQEMLTSIMSTSVLSSFLAISSYSSAVEPAILAMTARSFVLR